MNTLTPKDLKRIAKKHDEFCVSFSMPADNISGGNLSNRSRFRNMVENAKKDLLKTRLTAEKVKKILLPATDFLNDDTLWQDQFESLLVYLSNSESYIYKLPIILKEEVSISHYFNILPILEYLAGNIEFYLLMVDEGGAKLFSGNKYDLRDITTKALKNLNIESLMQGFDFEEEKFYHVESRGGRNKKHEGVVFHGHGNAKDDRKVRARDLFFKMETEITPLLEKKRRPLLLCGHKHLISIYREVNHYQDTLKGQIDLSREHPSNKELHEESLKVIDALARNELMEKRSEYNNNLGTGFTLTDLAEIYSANKGGKVATLYVDKEYIIYGQIDEKNSKIEVCEREKEGSENLSNLFAVLAINIGANVVFAEEIYLPEKGISALLRY